MSKNSKIAAQLAVVIVVVFVLEQLLRFVTAQFPEYQKEITIGFLAVVIIIASIGRKITTKTTKEDKNVDGPR